MCHAPVEFPGHSRDSSSASPSCVPGQALSPLAGLKPWSPVLVKSPECYHLQPSPQPQRLAISLFQVKKQVPKQACDLPDASRMLTKQAQTPSYVLYPKPRGSLAKPRAAAHPTNTPRCDPMPPMCLGFSLPRSTCSLPASFLQSTPTFSVPLTTPGAPHGWSEAHQACVQVSVSPHNRNPGPSLCHQELSSCPPSSPPKTVQEKGKGLEGQAGRVKGKLHHPAIYGDSGNRNPCSYTSTETQTGREKPGTPAKRDGNPGEAGPGRRQQRVIFNLLFLALRQKLI